MEFVLVEYDYFFVYYIFISINDFLFFDYKYQIDSYSFEGLCISNIFFI